MITLSHKDVFDLTADLARRVALATVHVSKLRPVKVYPIPRGGIPVAYMLLSHYPPKFLFELTSKPEHADIFIDDIRATGATAKRYMTKYGKPTYTMVEIPERNAWYTFPWEVSEDGVDKSDEDIVVRLLQYIGENPKREGLLETPKRVLKAWREWTCGSTMDAESVLKTFKDGAANYDEMVIVHNVPIRSYCEHHMAPITGFAHVGYIPSDRIVGLSKLARVADIYARRLQVQERMTVQIADVIEKVLKPKGVGVIIKASHGCMSSRGVNIHGGGMTTTSAMRGALLKKQEARAEFVSLCHAAEQSR